MKKQDKKRAGNSSNFSAMVWLE